MFLRARRQRSRSPSQTSAGSLRVTGMLGDGPLELTVADCAALPRDHQISDVSAYARRERGQGVRLKALIERARPRPEARYVNVRANDGRFRAALFRSAISELGIILYARDGKPIAPEAGGPFLLVLPGLHDVCAHIAALEELDFSTNPGPDDRRDPLLESLAPPIAGALYPPEEIAIDPARPRTVIVPPPAEVESP